jgi:UDP-GlcNAc3NAcA epimerase
VVAIAGGYALATVNRAQNTDEPRRLLGILEGRRRVSIGGLPVVLPLHPRTRKALEPNGLQMDGLRLFDPLY